MALFPIKKWFNNEITALSAEAVEDIEKRLSVFTESLFNKFIKMPSDILQDGTISTGGNVIITIKENTGELKVKRNGSGPIWIWRSFTVVEGEEEFTENELVRSIVKFGTTTLAPGSAVALPTTLGNFCATGINLEAPSEQGAPATMVTALGTEKSTAAEALAAIEGVTNAIDPLMRIKDVVIKKVAGGYEITEQRDRRRWARGAYGRQKRIAGNLTPAAAGVIDSTNLSMRMECSGAPIRLRLSGLAESTSATPTVKFGFNADGAAVDGTTLATLFSVSPAGTGVTEGFSFIYEYTPTPGTHLFQPTYQGSNAKVLSVAANPLIFTVEEIVRSSQNNGTS